MAFQSLSYPLALALLLFFTPMAQADSVQSSKSSGITVSISKIHVSQQKIILQFIVTNNTATRVYIRDASSDNTQKAFLGSGEHLRSPELIGIEKCDSEIARCLVSDSGYEGDNLNVYSYIEPSQYIAFGFTYEASSPVSESDTISFSVAMVARFAALNGDPSQAGSMKAIRFSFPYVPLTPH